VLACNSRCTCRCVQARARVPNAGCRRQPPDPLPVAHARPHRSNKCWPAERRPAPRAATSGSCALRAVAAMRACTPLPHHTHHHVPPLLCMLCMWRAGGSLRPTSS
jgi:hypothetical protein